MGSIIQLLENIPAFVYLLATLISVVLAIIGIVLYIKGKKSKSPCYSMRSTNLVRGLVSKIDSLEMRYATQPIENLTVTKILFWNAGRDTIAYSDVANADPLIIKVREGSKILDSKILCSNNPANQFFLSEAGDKSSLTLNFEYIDKDERALIQILHTGTSSRDIEIGGTVKGGSRLSRKYVPSVDVIKTQFPFLTKVSPKILRALMATFYAITPLVFLGLGLTLIDPEGKIAIIAMAACIAVVSWPFVYYYGKRRIPKGFETFEEKGL